MFRRRTQDPLHDETTSSNASLILLHFPYGYRLITPQLCSASCRFQVLTQYYSNGPSQADVAVFKAFSAAPDAEKYPNAARWYKHIASHEAEFATLPGDASKAYTVYGPESSDVTVNPAKAPAAEEDDDDVDLFGSDDEEEDPETVRIREERLAAYKEKKAAKPQTIAKSVVTLDVKPWGKSLLLLDTLTSRPHANRVL